MAYSHLGYSYSSPPQFLMRSGSLSSCLESGGRSLMETLTSPSHPALSYPLYEGRVLRSPPATGIGIYSCTYPKGQGYYNTCSGESPDLYSRNPLDSKEGVMPAQMGASQVPAYPYEYTFGQYPYDRYGISRYSCTDVTSRRKNATRETTSTLKAWLQEHQKNPYPTKGEKIMLAIITRMTLTQVSTWFANARRRLKKENKVTWSPRACKSLEDQVCDEDSNEEQIKGEKEPCDHSVGDLQSDLEDFDRLESNGSDSGQKTHFVPEDSGLKTPLAELSRSRKTIAIDSDTRKDRNPSDCPKLTVAEQQRSTFYPPREGPVDLPASTEATLKIWSIARKASSLQPEYPPCMLAYPSSPGYPASVGLTTTAATPSTRHDSPVATLRDWVDGVLHNGLFKQGATNQVLVESAVTAVWEGLSDVQMDSRAAGRSF